MKTPKKSRFTKLAAYLPDPLRGGENPDLQTLGRAGESLKKGAIFAATSLTALASLSLAVLNRAAGADSQKDALKTGDELWMENCTICHDVRPRAGSSSEQLDVIKRHMREEADLSPDEEEAILRFLEAGPTLSDGKRSSKLGNRPCQGKRTVPVCPLGEAKRDASLTPTWSRHYTDPSLP